jgi:hypothetical protein
MTKISSSRLTFFGRLILGGLALVVAAFAIQIGLIARLGAALKAIDPTPGMIHPVPDIGMFMIGAWVLVAIGLATVAAGFFRGIAYARRAGEGIGLTGFSYSLGWTAWSSLVPLLNLYRPWVGLGEIRRSLFVAQETRMVGNKWNRFGDISSATIALAAVILGAAGLEFVYNFLAILPTPHTMTEALAGLGHVRSHILANVVMIAVQAGALFVYLKTLAPPLRRLSDLAAAGALTVPA